VIITVASFFFLRDARGLLTFVDGLIPLPRRERAALFGRAQRMLRAVVYGIMFTSGVQAVLGGVGWWFVGLPNPFFFGSVMFVTGMIPFVGTPVVWLPGALYLLATDQLRSGILLLLWGGGVVSMVDNFIRPVFISEGSKVPVLAVFVGVIGGLAAFGFLGLFLGPTILSLSIFLLDTYRRILDARFGEEPSPGQEEDTR
jgi:predicted PurR-regulated permease PerM